MRRQEVVIFARTYDARNDEEKVVQVGEIHILSKKQALSNEKGVSNGHRIAQVEVPFEVAQRIIGQVPAICEIEYDISVENKALVLLPKNVQVLEEINHLHVLEEADYINVI